MANYISATRTNYFRVTDEGRYTEIFANLYGYEDDVEDFTRTLEDGSVQHGFGAFGEIGYAKDESYEPLSAGDEICDFLEDLAEILPEGEVCVVENAGWEKLRYVVGQAWIASKHAGPVYIDLRAAIADAVRKMLDDPACQLDDTY